MTNEVKMKKYKHQKYFSVDGHRYVVRADTLEQLYEKMAAKKQEIKEGGKLVSGTMTVSDWAYQCVETYKVNQKDVTREKYVRRMRHCILEHIGSMRLQDVKPIHCQKVMNLQVGKSKTQIREVYQTMNFIFNHAVSNHMIRSNPAESVQKPVGYTHARRALTSTERRFFEETVLTDRRFYLFALMLYCGCRPSEASACMGYDLQVKDGIPILHIRGTKTANADRYVPIPDKLWAAIKHTEKNEPIAMMTSGNPVTAGARKRVWSVLCREINLKMGCKTYRNALVPPYPLAPDLVPYNLRHEYCTNLARHKVDIRVAQRLMGHSDIKLTANIYTNLGDDDLVGVASSLPGVASGVAEKKGKAEKKRNAEF